MSIINEMHELLHEEVDKTLREVRENFNQYDEMNERNQTLFIERTARNVRVKSELLVEDICQALQKDTLNKPFLSDFALKNKFYEAGITDRVYETFKNPDILARIDRFELKEINQTYLSLATAAGTMMLGGVLKYVLQNRIDVSLMAILLGGLIVGGISYFQIPQINRKTRQTVLEDFLEELRKGWMEWLNEVEQFYFKEVERFKQNLTD